MRAPLFHPVMVHFAIGLLVTGVPLALVGSWRRWSGMRSGGLWAIWVGTVFAGLAVFTGLIAEEYVPSSGPLGELLQTHQRLGFIVLGVFAAVSAGWLVVELTPKKKLAPVLHVLGLIGIGCVLATGYTGGEMVFEHGAAVRVDGVAVSVLAAEARSAQDGSPATQPAQDDAPAQRPEWP